MQIELALESACREAVPAIRRTHALRCPQPDRTPGAPRPQYAGRVRARALPPAARTRDATRYMADASASSNHAIRPAGEHRTRSRCSLAPERLTPELPAEVAA